MVTLQLGQPAPAASKSNNLIARKVVLWVGVSDSVLAPVRENLPKRTRGMLAPASRARHPHATGSACARGEICACARGEIRAAAIRARARRVGNSPTRRQAHRLALGAPARVGSGHRVAVRAGQRNRLTTGRVAVHHNAGSMTRRSPSLLEREPDLFVEINSADALRLKVADGDEVTVTTPRGETTAYARITDRVKKGVVFMPFHFPGTNILTSEALDPEAMIPEFKVSACKITRRD